jgi:hypothetical protein
MKTIEISDRLWEVLKEMKNELEKESETETDWEYEPHHEPTYDSVIWGLLSRIENDESAIRYLMECCDCENNKGVKS